MDLLYASRVKFARTIAGQAGLNLVEEDIDQPRSSGRTIYVPRYSNEWVWGGKSANYWWYAFLHEIFHAIEKEDFVVMKKYKINMKSMFGYVYNLVLDHNIEATHNNMYPMINRVMMVGRSEFVEAQREKRSTFKDTLPELDAVWVMDSLVRTNWNSTMTIANTLLKELSSEALEKLEKIMPFSEEWLQVKTAEENYALACKIADALDIKDEAPEQTEGECESAEGDGDEPANDGEEKKVSGAILDYMDMLDHDHSGEDKPNGGPVKIDYSGWKDYTGWIPGPFEWGDPSQYIGSEQYYNAILKESTGATLSNEIRKWLQVVSRSKTESNRKRGKLDSRKLWKIGVHGVHSETGRRVFKSKIEKLRKDTSVLLLVDQSGSMCSNQKYIHAARASIILNNVLSELRIPVEIQSFADYGGKTTSYIHKAFANKRTDEELARSFSQSTGRMGGNSDGENIHHAADVLLRRKESRKIMIVLSDGQPASSNGAGDIYGWTKRVVREIETNSPIDIYGIGMMDAAVESIYSNCMVLNEASEVESTLLYLLKNHLLVEYGTA